MQSGGYRQAMPGRSSQQDFRSIPQGGRGMPQGLGNQAAMMQMLQQRMQGSSASAGGPAFMQMLQQKMQRQGGQGFGQQQPMQMPGRGMPSMSSGVQQPPMTTKHQRGFLNSFQQGQPRLNSGSTQSQDLESLMDAQYGR